ncbi:Conserved protein, with a weak D-galactarate dehydratase/altronate hydrolase domain [hydrothermal vent metagenome]|uniref:Conserved protein, with a weak D-galactarate dehydratase/altronate hydrolase domain n=1 Tax=hydrothermal vent metagenome TaxID=652676 RepID=A0A1W1CM85_9ZZZZ
MKKKEILPIGRSDFRELRREGSYYIDKTIVIQELMENSTLVYLLPRPRRFGKTLLQTTFRYFFEKEEENNEWLFKDLAIYKTEIFEKHFARYPVIYLTFKDVKSGTFQKNLNKIYDLILGEFSRHQKEIDAHIEKLEMLDKMRYKRLMSFNANQEDYENSLRILSKLLYYAFDSQVIFLLDEYDTPIQTAFFEGYYDEMIQFFKPFLGGILKDNDRYLKKAVITGILRVSGESMFSDVNNIEICTLLYKTFSTACGFTIKESQKMLKDFGLEHKSSKIIDWYDGYNFAGETILNPWSLINYVKNEEFNAYWANTSSNSLIRVMVENSKMFRKDLETLLNGGYIEKIIDSNITFDNPNFYFNEKILYSFLFFSGYLKCEDRQLIMGRNHCKLKVVNIECQVVFENIISSWLNSSFENYRLQEMLKSLIDGKLKLFEKLFSIFVKETLSFYDTAKNPENVYHAFLLGILVHLGEYEVISNQESGFGRLDVMVLHKFDKTRPAIIMELKTIDEFDEETKETALKSAVEQIEEKQYITTANKRGYYNICAFGLVFEKKRVWVKEV